MIRIRLRRMGAKKRAFYRFVAADQRDSRDGRFIEVLGTYDPNQDPPEISLHKDRVEYWLKVGAQPSDTARGLLKRQGFLGGVAEAKPEKKAESRKKGAKAAEAPAEAPTETPAEEPVTETPAEG